MNSQVMLSKEPNKKALTQKKLEAFHNHPVGKVEDTVKY